MTQAEIIEKYIISSGGCTDEEGQDATGINGNTWRPARVGLREAGLVCDSGEKRPAKSGRESHVWRHCGEAV